MRYSFALNQFVISDEPRSESSLIKVYPWHCLVPCLMNVPMPSLDPPSPFSRTDAATQIDRVSIQLGTGEF